MSEQDKYLSIEARSEGIFRDRGSKFLAFAFPVFDVEEIKKILDELRKEYHDARHHCYAYRLGADMSVYRANDDGEPSNSAGKPILGQIQSQNLTNVLIVVVRYFGGSLLGVGGLINAYRSAARDALENARIIEEIERTGIRISYPYTLTNEVMKIINEENLIIMSQDFTEVCRLDVLVAKSELQRVIERINKLSGAEAG